MSLFLGAFAVWDLASTSVSSSDHGDYPFNLEVIHATSGAIRTICLSDDGQYLDVVQGSNLSFRRDVQSGSELHNERLSQESLLRVQFIDNTRGWIAINPRNEVELIRDGLVIWRGRMPEQYDDETLIECAQFGSSNRIVVASKQGTLWLFGVDKTGINPIAQYSLGTPIADMKASLAGDQLVLVMGNRDVLIWDLDREQVVRRITTGDQDVRFARWSQNGNRLVTFGFGGTVKVWNVSTGLLAHELMIDSQMVVSAELSSDGTRLAAGDGSLIRVWDLSDRDEKCTLIGHSGMICSLTFADQGKTLFSGDLQGSLRRWSLEDDQEIWAVP